MCTMETRPFKQGWSSTIIRGDPSSSVNVTTYQAVRVQITLVSRPTMHRCTRIDHKCGRSLPGGQLSRSLHVSVCTDLLQFYFSKHWCCYVFPQYKLIRFQLYLFIWCLYFNIILKKIYSLQVQCIYHLYSMLWCSQDYWTQSKTPIFSNKV